MPCVTRLNDDEKSFGIYSVNDELIENMTDSFYVLIKKMIEEDEIPEMPEYIKGIAIRKVEDKYYVLGIGKLKMFSYQPA